MLEVASANQFDWRLKAQPVLAEVGVPHRVTWDYCCIRMQRYACYAGGGAGLGAEEVYEDAFLRHGVLVGQDSYGALLFQ